MKADSFRSGAIDYKLRDFYQVVQVKKHKHSAAIKRQQSIKHLSIRVKHEIIKAAFRSCGKMSIGVKTGFGITA